MKFVLKLFCAMQFLLACGVKLSPKSLLPNLPYAPENEVQFTSQEIGELNSEIEEEVLKRKKQSLSKNSQPMKQEEKK